MSSVNSNNKPQSQPDVATIDLGDGRQAIIDADLQATLSLYKWRAVQYHRLWYARLVPDKALHQSHTSMHRMIAQTPANQICHHRNRNSLDNRRANLLNMTRDQHELLHKNNSLLIKFATPRQREPIPSLPRPDI